MVKTLVNHSADFAVFPDFLKKSAAF